ncbi:hypothetical protein D3C78_1018490 [compost metagenome]
MMDIPLRKWEIPYSAAYGVAALMEWSHQLLPILGEPPLTRYSIGVLARSQTLDIGAARERLGYAPKVSLNEGLRTFAEWWRTDGR